MIRLTFTLDLLSDYHISAGHGVGALLDSALQRDADGVPVIRGTTLVGLLRQGLRDLVAAPAFSASYAFQTRLAESDAHSNDPGRPPEESDLLFGAPWSPKRWFISSARPENLLDPQDPAQSVTGFAAHAAAHVRVDPALRRADARKLFMREEGDQNLRFIFTAECSVIDSDSCPEATLMVAVARMVRHLGAGRRRGRGACKIHLTDVKGWPLERGQTLDEGTLLQHFADYWLGGQPNELLPQIKPAPEASGEVDPDQPLRLIMLLRTDEPVLIARRAAAGNQFEGLDHIPGVSIRGALGALVGARSNLDNNQDNRATFTRLFFRNQVRFSPLYPCHQEKEFLYPTIPAPIDLFVTERHSGKQLKEEGHHIYTAQQAARIDFSEEITDDKEAKLGPLGSYLTVLEKVPLIKVPLSSEMHLTIDPETGRAMDENLFSYSVIPAGQYFMGEWSFDNGQDWLTLREMAGLPATPEEGFSDELAGDASESFSLRLGKATRRGYGKVSAVFMRSHNDAVSLFAGLGLKERVAEVKQPLIMTLISPTIVLDAWGRGQQGFDEAWLTKELGIEVEIVRQEGPLGIRYPLKFANSQVIDSFNNVMGLARHRDMALKAGSAVTLRVNQAISLTELQARLEKIEFEGLGMRRNEGFGRVIFNHPVYQDACQGVEATEIEIPSDLELGKALASTIYSRTKSFEKRWIKTLASYTKEQWKKIKYAEFDAMAREIDSAWVRSLRDAHDLFDSYGKLEHLLVGNLFGRPKLEFFTDEKRGQPGVEFLKEVFRELATLLKDEAASQKEQTLFWIMGCRELARRMDEVIDKDKERSK